MQKMLLAVVLVGSGLWSSMYGMMGTVDIVFDTETVTIARAEGERLTNISLRFVVQAHTTKVDLKNTNANAEAFKKIIASLDSIEANPFSFINDCGNMAEPEYNALLNTALYLRIDTVLCAAQFKAVHDDAMNVLRAFIREGISCDQTNEEGDTLLIKACELGRETIVQTLLQAHANLSAKGREGKTALMRAAEKGHESIVTYILRKNPGVVNDTDDNGETALMAACRNGNRWIVDSLLRERVNVLARGNKGSSALHIAADQGDESIVYAILRRDTQSASLKDLEGKTPLMIAAQKGHHRIVEIIYDNYKTNVDEKDVSGKTALFWAAAGGHSSCVSNLVRSYWGSSQTKADTKIADDKKRTPFMIACKNGNKVTTEALLTQDYDERKAQLELRDIDGCTPLILAARKQVNGSGYVDTIKLLVEHRADMTARDIKNRTALMWASYQGNVAAVKYFIEKEADVHLFDSEGETALSLASAQGHTEIVTLLLKGKAAVNSQGNDGGTALHRASAHGHKAVVETLIAASSRINHQDDKGRTALMKACKKGHLEVVTMLLNEGARVDLKDKKDNTALSFALSSGNKEVEKLVHKGPRNKWLSIPRLLIGGALCYGAYYLHKKYTTTEGDRALGQAAQAA